MPRLRAVTQGRLAALGSAFAFGTVAPLAGFAYSSGASPSMIVLVRILFGLLAAAMLVSLYRRSWAVPRGARAGTVAVAVAWTVVNVGYMASFFYIPVSLAVLIFFTFPVLIALVAPLVEGRRPNALTLSAAALSFLGLLLALGPDIGGLDWRGFALAFSAAMGVMATFVISRQLLVEQDMFSFSFHLHLLCMAAVGLLLLPFTGLSLPATQVGWMGVLGVGGLYVCGVLLQFSSIRLAGPSQAALVCNVEPVVVIVGAWLLLGENLGLWQGAGAVLVIAAVLLSTRADRGVLDAVPN